MKNLLKLLTPLFILMSTLYSLQIYAQPPNEPPTVVLNRTYGGSGSDVSRMVHQTPDGGFIIAGDTDTGLTPPDRDIYLIKTDEYGDVEWEKTYGSPQPERIQWAMNNALQITSDGGFIVIGTTEEAGNLDFYLIKTDSDGNLDLTWGVDNPKTFGGLIDDYGRVVRQTIDGGYILAGQTYDPTDIYLIKTDELGILQWQKTYRLNSWSTAQDIIQTDDGGFLVTGYGGAGLGAFLLKTDASGNPLNDYSVSFVGGGSIHDAGGGTYEELYADALGYNIEKTIDGGYIVAGRIKAGVSDGFLVKLDPQCNVEWKKDYPGLGANYAYAVQQLDNGEYVVAGETNGMGNGGWDFWVFGTNTTGDLLWETTYGGPGGEWATSLQLTQDGGFVITGLNSSFGAGGGHDFWLLKLLRIVEPACITGNVYADHPGYCTFNGNDHPLFNRLVQAQAGADPPYFTFTDDVGDYKFVVEAETGGIDYLITLVSDPSTFNFCPLDHTVNVIPNDIKGGNDFGVQLIGPDCASDVRIISAPFLEATCTELKTLTSPCPGWQHKYEILICNDLGQEDIQLAGNGNSEIVIELPVGMSYVEYSFTFDCSVPISGNSPDFAEPIRDPEIVNQGDPQLLKWINNMQGKLRPSECCLLKFTVDVDIDVFDYASDPFKIEADFKADCGGNNDISESHDEFLEYYDCSCDPNDKTVSPKGCGPYGNILKDQDLSYVIRFENIGTGPAHNIVIRDVLDSDFDLSTFRLLRSSHTVSNLQIENGNELVIRFNDIELPPAGKGEVLFNIEPKPNLPEGTTITNYAAIHFDFNPPVITNETLNTMREVPSPEAAFTATRVCSLGDNIFDFAYTGSTVDGATYAWDFGPNASPSSSTDENPTGIVFSNNGPQEVSLTVSRYGCSATITEAVEVIDISCGNNGNKILICHSPGGNPNNSQTLCISPNAAAAHLAHGDVCGPCEYINQQLIIPGGSEFDYVSNPYKYGFDIYPNPVNHTLHLDLHNYLEQEISISIYTHLGQQLVSLSELQLVEPFLNIDLTSQLLPNGIYLISVWTEEGQHTKQFVISR